MKKFNIPVIVTSMVLMAVSVIGFLVAGQFLNPPGARIVVAVVEIPTGTVLTSDMVRVDTVQGNAKVTASHVQEKELNQFIGAVAVEPIHKYSYIPKSALSVEGNPAASNRLALALSDKAFVAMVVPVSPETAPDAMVEGDRVDLNFGTNGDRSNGQKLTTRPTDQPGLSQMYDYSPSAASSAGTPAATGTPTPTPTPDGEPLLVLPVAKTIVRQAKILGVVREQLTQQTQVSGEAVNVTVPGKMLAIVVAVPREAQELMQFAIDNGNVRVSLLSAQVSADAPERQPSLGMTWNDLVSLMRMDRDAALATMTPANVMGPGAYAIEATRVMQTQVFIEAQATQKTVGRAQPSAAPISQVGPTSVPTATPAATATPKK
jgi:hypothetical protein